MILDERRGEIIDEKTGEVIMERLPMLDAKYNVQSVSDDFYKTRRMLPYMVTLETKSKIYFNIETHGFFIKIRILIMNHALNYKRQTEYIIVLKKAPKKIELNEEIMKYIKNKIRKYREKAKRAPHLANIVFLAIVQFLLDKRIITTWQLKKKKISIYREGKELSPSSIASQLEKVKKRYWR